MKISLTKTLSAGIAATAVMTMVTFAAPMMGLPKMNPAEMLSGMMGVPVAIGWLMHFMVGVVFAAAYAFLFLPNVKLPNLPIKGALFGIAVFVFAQIMMVMMSFVVGPMPMPEGGMMLTIVGSVIGHVVYGDVVALVARP
ncbi:MAG: hypothetical protein PHP42_07900 [Bacteroidota bacterium]|nr:hypothetical protein [Bacteroidota bacterium]